MHCVSSAANATAASSSSPIDVVVVAAVIGAIRTECRATRLVLTRAARGDNNAFSMLLEGLMRACMRETTQTNKQHTLCDVDDDCVCVFFVVLQSWYGGNRVSMHAGLSIILPGGGEQTSPFPVYPLLQVHVTDEVGEPQEQVA